MLFNGSSVTKTKNTGDVYKCNLIISKSKSLIKFGNSSMISIFSSIYFKTFKVQYLKNKILFCSWIKWKLFVWPILIAYCVICMLIYEGKVWCSEQRKPFLMLSDNRIKSKIYIYSLYFIFISTAIFVVAFFWSHQSTESTML